MIEPTCLSVNIQKNTIPEATPSWPVGRVYQTFHYGKPIRVTKHEAQMVQKRHRSVVPMRIEDFVGRFHEAPEIFIGRSQGIGDILMLTPALRVLAKEGWKITLAVMHEFVDIVKHNPDIAHVVGCKANEMPITDIASTLNLNLQVERIRGMDYQMPRADLFAKLLSVKVPMDKRLPILILGKSEKRKAKKLLGEKKWVGVCVRTSTTARNYPYTQELVELLAKKKHNVVLLHHEPPAKTGIIVEHERVLDLQGKTTSGVMCAIIDRCSCVISPDSGPMHVALTLKTPCVCLEGPMPVRVYLSSYAGSPKKVMVKDLPCIGCGHDPGHWMACEKNDQPDHECMRFPPKDVVAAVEEIGR